MVKLSCLKLVLFQTVLGYNHQSHISVVLSFLVQALYNHWPGHLSPLGDIDFSLFRHLATFLPMAGSLPESGVYPW